MNVWKKVVAMRTWQKVAAVALYIVAAYLINSCTKTKVTVLGYTEHSSKSFDWVEHRDNNLIGIEFETSDNGGLEFTDFTNSYGNPSFAINYNYRWRSDKTQSLGLKCGYARGYNDNPTTWQPFCLPAITGDFERLSFDFHIVPGVVWILFLKVPFEVVD